MELFELPIWATGINLLIAFFGVLILVGGAFVVLLMRSRTEISGLQIDRATAAEALLKTRDQQIGDKNARIAELEHEIEDLTSEHRTLTAIVLEELFTFWETKEEKEAQLADLQRQVRILNKRKDGDSNG